MSAASPQKPKKRIPKSPPAQMGNGLAKTLLGYVRSVEYMNKSLPDPIDFDNEVARLRGTLQCANCNSEINVRNSTNFKSAIYCSEYCKQMAGTVRYVRRAMAAQRESEYEFRMGLNDRLIHMPTGGYAAQERRLSKKIRMTIFERDNNICRICRKRPAEQIDHIKGSSSDLSNLQAICVNCHRMKTNSNLRLATGKELKRILKFYEAMALRIVAANPSKACDDYERWQKTEPKLRGIRQKMINKIKQEIGGKT